MLKSRKVVLKSIGCLILTIFMQCTNKSSPKFYGLFSLVSPSSNISQFSVGGLVSGLNGTVVLQNNLTDSITINSNGAFTFSTLLSLNSTYSVTVLTQPSSQTCTVSNAIGTISNTNIVNINVTCTSSSNTLSDLLVSTGTLNPAFSSTTYSYIFSVLNSVSSIAITPIVSNVNTTTKVNGVSVTSGSASDSISLSVGSNTITVLVTAQDNSTSTYTITVIRSTLNAYRIFVTSSTYDGNLIGSATLGSTGADAKCNADGNKPSDGSTYKAMITDVTNRSACSVSVNCASSSENIDWVLKANSAYARTDGTPLFTTNSAGIFVFGVMTNSFSGGGQYWTGISTVSQWMPSGGGNNCNKWTSNSGGLNGNYGDGAVTSYTAIAIAASACSALKSILCAEQ